MADDATNPQGTIILRLQDIQTIVAGLATNPDTVATIACLMLPPLPPGNQFSRESPSSSIPSSTSQSTSSGKFANQSSFRSHLYISALAHARVKHGYRRDNS